MKALEEITYEAGRHALADQEALVARIQQRTGTLLAAHALVASFFGGTALTSVGLGRWGWVALTALVLGLVVAAILLAPWDLKFSVDASDLYDKLFAVASAETSAEDSPWLVQAAYGYVSLREQNAPTVQWMARGSGLLAVLMVVQTLAWFIDLAR